MNFTFMVTVDVSRQQGKFASRDDISEKIKEALDDANPGDIEGENGGEYTVDTWEVEEKAS